MANKENKLTKNDLKDKVSIIEIIKDIDYRLTHLEDMQADNRELIVKLVKQGNTIVEFLKQFEINELSPEEIGMEAALPELPNINSSEVSSEENIKKTEALKNIIDDILDRHQDLKEFEEELKKHKDKLTPGQAGEA